MKLKLKYLVIIFCAVVLVFRYEEIYNIYKLLYYWVSSAALGNYQQAGAEVFDYFFSALILILLPLYSFVSKSRIMNYNINTSVSLMVLLFLSAVTTPVITSFDPEFQKNIAVTRLLPPLQQRYLVLPEKKTEDYADLKKEVLKVDHFEALIQQDGSVQQNFKSKRITYLLGTDELGRDIFSRLMYGTRISMTVGIFSVTISLVIGLLLGFLAGYYEGWGGSALNRVTDVFLSFPPIFLIILILALFGNSILSVIIVLGFTGWMSLFKIIRSEVKSLRSKDYFITASALGISRRNLIFKEMLPVVIVPVINNLVLLFGGVIVAEASLSYLGLGTGMMHPSWGSMIDQGQSYMRSAWWMILMPGLFLFITLFSANNIGRNIQSYFNPRLK